MIRETIITTLNADDTAQIAPMGIREQDGLIVIAPFKPSTTLENLKRSGQAVVNLTDDVRVFAGCLTGRYDWPVVPATSFKGMRLQNSLSHMEVVVDRVEDDNLRPRFFCKVQHQETHRPFAGFNRAQAAVLELAILVSRLHMLPAEKIDAEVRYLEIAIEKTAGNHEREAWNWLIDKITDFRQREAAKERMV